MHKIGVRADDEVLAGWLVEVVMFGVCVLHVGACWCLYDLDPTLALAFGADFWHLNFNFATRFLVRELLGDSDLD